MSTDASTMQRSLAQSDIEALARRVEVAQQGARAIPKLTLDFPGMTLGDAYAVQLELLQRWQAQGRRQVGWKAGLTSQAKMQQMGVRVPTIGFLLADMDRPDGATLRIDELVHPRVECEIAFVTRQALRGPDCSREQVLQATDFVVPALEVIDSRYAGFSFDLPSVVADNSSSARYLSGGRARRPADIDLGCLGVVLEKNGQAVAMGASAAVSGHPADAVALVVKVLHQLGRDLPAGSFVMSGGITEAVAVRPGDFVSARFQELASVSARFA